MMQMRTHTCNELRLSDAGRQVKLVGWMENVRVVGSNFAFVVLRDFYGTTQVVIESEDMMAAIRDVNKESTISVEGVVRERSSKNPKLPTGEIEVVPNRIEVLGRCRYNSLPFEINRSREADETARLKYRYLDLRNPAVKNNIILRCQVVAALRAAMTEHGFLEITTPILTASSPEGARDYLVPARKHPGKFYALPQAPQQFKQLLMTSGFDRYFQIAPCFRDEDARGDRSPGEFYQLDMEMAFATQDDVFAVLEDVLPPIFAKYGTYDVASAAPFRRIAYNDALAAYGSDKPDLRIDLTCKDVSTLFVDSAFEPLQGKTVKMVDITDCALTRKQVEKLLTDCEVQSGVKGYWFKVDESGELAGGIAKFVTPVQEELAKVLCLRPGTLVVVSAGEYAVKSAGVQIKTFGPACEGHMDKERYEFCWIVDFPMYEIGDESGELEFCHNPFSMPSGGLETLLKAERGELDPLDIYANQYDLVCNGVELSSGAVRNHDPEIMVKAFELVRLGEEDVKKKFPAMYNAFCYGAPPHAGIAPGVDRMVMLLAGESSIREIIPFPMNKNAQDVMMGAPSEVTQKQLDELHIAVVGEVEA
ncbi:MAG: aspartate--tRNA ligase [Ruminococcaceae bacterium]|jgi:aspartyl-tRNA synthetase|nr:aspartate--tRNA ligase [Oscillospiraceae bacterium]